MRCSAAPIAFVAATWLTQIDAFIATPGSRSSSIRCTHCSTCGSTSPSQTGYRRAIARRSFRAGVVRRRNVVPAMSGDDQEDGGKWKQVGAGPEELLRQMSIPELAQNLDQAESVYGQVHPQVAAALIPLSQALYANGDMGPARETCTRALKILQVAFGQTPRVETAECLHTLAMIQQAEDPQIGDKALGSQNMALELAMRVCGPESIEVAAYSRCLAQMSEEYSQYLTPGLPRPFYMPNPVPLYRQTLAILEKTIGADHPEVASALDDVASALLFWRDDEVTDTKAATLLPEAETLAARSLAISRESLGGEHPITAGREHNLGMIKRGLGREDDAREHFRRALAIREAALGADHPDTKSSRALVEEKDSSSTSS